MAIAIRQDSPHLPEIFEILHRFAAHSNVCDTCDPRTGKHCAIGGHILQELTQYQDVKEVPKDWKGDSTRVD